MCWVSLSHYKYEMGKRTKRHQHVPLSPYSRAGRSSERHKSTTPHGYQQVVTSFMLSLLSRQRTAKFAVLKVPEKVDSLKAYEVFFSHLRPHFSNEDVSECYDVKFPLVF